MAETDTRESAEFIKNFLFSEAALMSVLFGLFFGFFAFVLEYANRSYGQKWGKVPVVFRKIILFFMVLAWVVGCYHSRAYISLFTANTTEGVTHWKDKYECKPQDPISGLLYGFRGVVVTGEEMKKSVQTTQMMDRNNSICTQDDSINVVLVIGESYIKHHAGIYGYDKATTPRLEEAQKRGELFVFNNAVTPYASTSKVIRNILCCNSTSRHEQWFAYPYFLAIFKDAGYQVFLWDNQRSMSPGAGFTFALNSFLYDNEVKKLSYTRYNEEGYQYDEELLQSFDDNIKLTHNYNFVIYHLLGQHVDAKDRFPHDKENCHFNYHDVTLKAAYLTKEKRQEIADYDNATLYNDKVIGRIFQRFRNSSSVVVYISDHGEEIYDYRDSKGRIQGDLTKEMLKYQYEIPFMVWCSDKYQKKHPDIVEAIRQAVNRPVMSDDICHLMFHLGGIKTKYYKSERDYISADFRPCKRIVNDTADYDSLRWGK